MRSAGISAPAALSFEPGGPSYGEHALSRVPHGASSALYVLPETRHGQAYGVFVLRNAAEPVAEGRELMCRCPHVAPWLAYVDSKTA
jgi:hypothetical protein